MYLSLSNQAKLGTRFQALGIKLSSSDREKMSGWKCIVVSVPNRQMAVQLNKLAGYVPKLIFTVLPDQPIFTFLPGLKKAGCGKSDEFICPFKKFAVAVAQNLLPLGDRVFL